MKNKQSGFLISAMIAIVLILTVGGGGYIYFESKKMNNSKIDNTEIPISSTYTDKTENKLEIKDNITQENSTTTKKNEDIEKINASEINKQISTASTTEKPKTTQQNLEKTQISASIDLRFDNFFKKWITAWKKRDADVLINIFGYADFQVQNKEDDVIWHYNSYQLYKSKTTPPSESDVAVYKELGRVPFDGKVVGYYIVSKTNDVYNIAIINGNYKKDSNIATINQWQIFPSEYNPKVFSSIQDAKNEIDKLAGI